MSDQEMTFEKAMSGAEKIAAKLAAGGCTLDEALPLYEEGVTLLAHAKAKLAHIEQRAKELLAQPDGTCSLVDIDDAMSNRA